jgi:hypothetical protein
MITNLKPKEATAIINSLSSGVVPKTGVQHIVVGRKAEVDAFVQALEDVKNGHSMVKFWIGDFGSGKSFMLHVLNTVALKARFVVANADFTPDNRLYANDGKGRALYSAIMDNIAIQTKPEGGALPALLEKWIEQVLTKTATDHNIPLHLVREEVHLPLVQSNISKAVQEVTEVGGFDFGLVILKYYEGYIRQDDRLRLNALRWLKGEYTTKTEARQDLGVRDIIDDLNFYDMLKNFCKFFVSMGYSGFMVNLDEAINLYKIGTSAMREKNYEKILMIYNDCFQGKVSNLFINFAGTNEVLENERRGFYSYRALRSRLETNRFETAEYRDFAQPVIRLKPLDFNQVFVLLQMLREIFNVNYSVEVPLSDEEILQFMEELYNKPGAAEFLLPREVIRDFLGILSLLRQHPGADKKKMFAGLQVKDERPKDVLLEDIEEL